MGDYQLNIILSELMTSILKDTNKNVAVIRSVQDSFGEANACYINVMIWYTLDSLMMETYLKWKEPYIIFRSESKLSQGEILHPNQYTEAEAGDICYCFKDTSIEKETLSGAISENAYYVRNHTSKVAVFGLAQRIIYNGQEKNDILPLYAETLLPEGQSFFTPTAKIGLCIVKEEQNSKYIPFEAKSITWFCLEENKALTICYDDDYRFKKI